MWWRVAGAVAMVIAVAASCGDDDATATVPAPGSAAPTTEPGADTTVTTGTAVTTAAPTAVATTVPGVVPTGFAQTAAEVTLADGTVCELCLWVAATDVDRARGLMGVTDLGGADGMVFVYTDPTTGNFWMKDTVMPLTIGFFAADGSFVSATDMEPCTEANPALCTRYAPEGPYTHAVEVPAGRLDELGIGPGSRLRLLSAACPEQ